MLSRRFPRIIFRTLFALALPITTFSQSPAPRDPRAIAILQQSFAMMGGAVPQDATLAGSVIREAGGSSESGTVRILTRGLNQSIEELRIAEEADALVYSGGRAKLTRTQGEKNLPMERAVTSQSAAVPLVSLCLGTS